MKITLNDDEKGLLLALTDKGIGKWVYKPAYDFDAYDVYSLSQETIFLISLEEKGFIKIGLLKFEPDYAEDIFLRKYYQFLKEGRLDDARSLSKMFDMSMLDSIFEKGIDFKQENIDNLLDFKNPDASFGKDLCGSMRLEIEVLPSAPEYVAKYFTDFIDGENEVNTSTVYINKTFFNEEKSILYIQGEKCKIRKFSKQYEVLRIIFTEPTKDWQLSEISEMVDSENKDKYHWKTFYNYLDALRRSIIIQINIKDFFILTTQSVKIEPKYLEDKEPGFYDF